MKPLILMGVLAANLAFGADGGSEVGTDAGVPKEASPTPCSKLHPAQFTYVIIQNQKSTDPAYKPEAFADGKCAGEAGNHEGRFAVPERGEIVIRFDAKHVGEAAGTLMVTGRVLSKNSTREIPVPGYRVLGQAETPQGIVTQKTIESAIVVAEAIAKTCKADDCDVTKSQELQLDPLRELPVAPDSALGEFKMFALSLESRKTEASAALAQKAIADGAAARTQSQSLEMSWSEVRIQPKSLGVEQGDVIEIDVKHTISGQSVSPTWILRFVVEKTGIYVQVSPVLSLVWSHHFSPVGEFRGTQGVLAPGVEFTINWHAGRYQEWQSQFFGFLVSGIGLGVDYLDFDSRQAIELGLKVNLQLFSGILSVGVGYNLGPQDPRWSDRALYWSIGIGIDKVLDRAAKVAAFFAQ